MPVYSFYKVSLTSFFLIWKIEESVEALRARLCPQFLDDFLSLNLSSKNKIRQSLAVRISLYYLLKKLALPIPRLAKNQQGRPILEDTNLHISFSHTTYLAAVALSTAFPVGIDIEMIDPTLDKVKSRFLTEREIESGKDWLEKLTIYWSAKEALYKQLDREPIVTFKDIFIDPFDLHTKGKLIAHLNKKQYAMAYQSVVDRGLLPHVLVYSLG